MSDLNSRREITDRVGQTVILGNSIEDGAVSGIATVVAAAAGAAVGAVPISASAIATLDMYNGSFGIWAVYSNIQAAALLRQNGASIAASRFNDIAAGLLTWGADAVLLNIRVITATGTYTPTAGTVSVVVQCLGGGGGGAGVAATSANNAIGGGGGAGAMAIGRITSGFSGVTVTIGAAGAGGAAGQNNGIAGGATTFGSVLSGGGGAGGTSAIGTFPQGAGGGVGGSASGSASLFGARGADGHVGFAITASASNSGRGGDSAYGSGGPGQVAGNSSSAIGNGGSGYGSGGGGALAAGTEIARVGGTGTQGICIIYEYNG
jgi:hypothetical protein